MADWKGIVGTVAPAIAAALGGPLAGLGVSALAGARTRRRWPAP